jgi:inorganic pyrophosphatase/exopolyphosphatase
MLKRFLKDRFHMDFKREWYVGFDREYGYVCRISESVNKKDIKRFRWKNPDLLCIHRKYGLVIVELDGAVHDRKVAKTEERNELFRNGGIKLVVLNISDIKESGQTITQRLEKEMLQITL